MVTKKTLQFVEAEVLTRLAYIDKIRSFHKRLAATPSFEKCLLYTVYMEKHLYLEIFVMEQHVVGNFGFF
jgi:hypothetical protein